MNGILFDGFMSLFRTLKCLFSYFLFGFFFFTHIFVVCNTHVSPTFFNESLIYVRLNAKQTFRHTTRKSIALCALCSVTTHSLQEGENFVQKMSCLKCIMKELLLVSFHHRRKRPISDNNNNNNINGVFLQNGNMFVQLKQELRSERIVAIVVALFSVFHYCSIFIFGKRIDSFINFILK